MPISEKVDLSCLRRTPFKITKDQFKILGTIATHEHRNFLKSNWECLIQELKHNIEFWNTKPISLVGRINAIKMVTHPRFPYIILCIPVFIPLYYFKQLDSVISPVTLTKCLEYLKNTYVNTKQKEALFSRTSSYTSYTADRHSQDRTFMLRIGNGYMWLHFPTTRC